MRPERHRGVLVALEESSVADHDPARLAHHAAETSDPEKILEYSVPAGIPRTGDGALQPRSVVELDQ
jgi:hypothetical protein